MPREALREPAVLLRGKAFHKQVQAEWKATAKDGMPHLEEPIKKWSGSSGRMDIFVDNMGDLYSVVEIKSTNWDRIKRANITRNARRHIRQLWRYIDAVMAEPKKAVSRGIVYPMLPSSRDFLELIEFTFNEDGIQVVWQNESMGAVRLRMERKEKASTTGRGEMRENPGVQEKGEHDGLV